MSGLTPTGFEIKSLETILSEIKDEIHTNVSPNVNLETSSPTGQIVGVLARNERLMWELAQAVYSGQYPDSASGFSLTSLAALTGTARRAASPSLVTASVNIDPGTYAIGTLVAHVINDPTSRFVNRDAVTNGTASPDDFDVVFQSEENGPVRAYAGTLTVIAEAVSGWNTVTNALDADLGQNEESDSELRARREAELARRGSTTAAAIRVDVADVADVDSVTVLENDTDVTVNGIPPHSIEALVLGGLDAEIAEAILLSKPAGIRAYGSTTEYVIDDQGESHRIQFTRPTEKDIWMELDVAVDESVYAGDDVLKETIADYGDLNQKVSFDVIHSRIVAIAMGVTGVRDVTELRLGFFASPTGTTNLTISSREIARFDTSRIAVDATQYVDG